MFWRDSTDIYRPQPRTGGGALAPSLLEASGLDLHARGLRRVDPLAFRQLPELRSGGGDCCGST